MIELQQQIDLQQQQFQLGIHALYMAYKRYMLFRIWKTRVMKRWAKEVEGMHLTPSCDEIIAAFEGRESIETFEATWRLALIVGEEKDILLNVPVLIDISRLGRFIVQNQDGPEVSVHSFEAKSLLPYVSELTDEEFNANMHECSALKKEKGLHPIILMKESVASKAVLVNGSHRVIVAAEKDEKVNVYCVSASLCSKYGMTSDYHKLFQSMIDLMKKLNHFPKKHN